ncbi:MAG: hypothetical protein LBG64_00615 [Pseudomonadales bacterium]|jgi:hypothetical protein|nr:hypothetical protein [Pseudomonadales bacterium]
MTLVVRQQKQKGMILEGLAKNSIVEVACQKSGVSRATYYRWLKDDPEFAAQAQEAIDKGVASVNDLAVSKLLTAIQGGNITAIQFWLRKMHPKFRDKLEVSGQISTQHQLTAEEEQLLSNALELAGLTRKDENG